MDPDQDEAEVNWDTEEPSPVGEDEEEEREEDEEEDEEEDARIFNAWMQQYRGRDRPEKSEQVEESEEAEPEGGRAESRNSSDPPVLMKADRRASLPCPVGEPFVVSPTDRL